MLEHAAPVRVHLAVDVPGDLAGLMLPAAVDRRLCSLLDKQDRGDPLTDEELAEAEGLVELADLLSLIRLRATHAASPAPR